ncbi:MAG: Holliday junction resolvase RuvX [Pseudomonadota bacterium]
MAICALSDLPERGVLLGLDPGTKTIGVAASDRLRLIATPVETITRSRKMAPALDRLFALAADRETVGLVIGLPLNMDGTEGPRAQSARAFARNIIMSKDFPIAFQDERLSSAQAERDMIASDVRREKRAALIDASAAAIILQTALDRLANADD